MNPTAAKPEGTSIHATAVMVGEAAVLIRGTSGAGKSRLGLALLNEARRGGLFARLIGDDSVVLRVTNGRAVASGHPAILGLIEERSTGIVEEIPELAGVIRCVVELRPEPPRMPASAGESVQIGGLAIPCLSLLAGGAPQEGARRILAFLARS